ncbi:hypothetical protein [Rummeliibacillus suwonensis]|uniref:hypothetical protein n=1 Tax=Rummeliibacillus suwonensis TaxID=1306154 RepID=UPI0028979509|nr:hypothetical protein [Rummeliibacillus suwonensis]
MNKANDFEFNLNKNDFELDFEISSDAMEATGELETWGAVTKLVTKVTCKTSCTCQCTIFCGA